MAKNRELARLVGLLEGALDGVECVDVWHEVERCLARLSADLDPVRHPELARHLQGTYELCLEAVAAARAGRPDGLMLALSLLRAVLRAEGFEASVTSGVTGSALVRAA